MLLRNFRRSGRLFHQDADDAVYRTLGLRIGSLFCFVGRGGDQSAQVLRIVGPVFVDGGFFHGLHQHGVDHSPDGAVFYVVVLDAGRSSGIDHHLEGFLDRLDPFFFR